MANPLSIWSKSIGWEKYVDNNRAKYPTAEDYYNNKYPKRNITFPNIESDRKDVTSSKSFTLYNVDVRTILNSKSFRLPKIPAIIPQKQSRMSSAINFLEEVTGYDLDKDGDIGLAAGNPIEIHNQIALDGLRWVIDNIRYTQLNDTGEDRDTGIWSYHRKMKLLDEPASWVEKQVLDGENWSFSYQTLDRKNGDCEDGAILLYDILRNSGIPAWKLRLNAGFVKGDGGNMSGHCWLSYYVESQFWKTKRDDKWVILDWCYLPDRETKVGERLKTLDNKSYGTIDFSFNEEYTWSFDKVLFAPFFHSEDCILIKSNHSGFDWETKVCNCGTFTEII